MSSIEAQKLLAAQTELEVLSKKYALATKLANFEGFYNTFLDQLSRSKTTQDAFDKVNDLYYEIFGHYKYSCIKSFRVNIKRYHNKK